MKQKKKDIEGQSFTLQFGDESESVPIESQADAAALVNDNFMWHNAATLLEEADARKQAGVIPLHSDDEEIQEFEADDDLEDEFSAKTANVPDALTIDEFEEEAIDERTMPMGPILEIEDEAEDYNDPNGPIGPVYASASMAPPIVVGSAGQFEAVEIDAVEQDQPMRPVVAAASQKTPWLVYGTLGAGVCVLSVALIGMLMQMNTPTGSGASEVALAPEIEPPSDVAPVEALVAQIEPVQDAPAPSGVEPQLIVANLVGPSGTPLQPEIALAALEPSVVRNTPAALLTSAADVAFTRLSSEPLSSDLTSPLGENFGGAEPTDALVSLNSDRIEIDLSTPASGPQLAFEATLPRSPEFVADPVIARKPAPLLASVSVPNVQAPQESFAALALLESIDSLSGQIEALSFAPVSFETSSLQSEVVAMSDPEVTRSDAAVIDRFALNDEITVGLVVPQDVSPPLAAVKLAFASDTTVTLDDISGLEISPDAGLIEVKETPGKILDQAVVEPILPSESTQTSPVILASLAVIETPQFKSGPVGADISDNTGLSGLASLASRLPSSGVTVDAAPEQVAALSTSEVAPVVAPTVAPPPKAAAQEEIKTARPLERASASDAATSVAQARWVPDLGVLVRSTTDNGLPALEITDIQEGASLPEQITSGKIIRSVNGFPVGDLQSLTAALMVWFDETSDVLKAELAVKGEEGALPDVFSVDVPLWRFVKLENGTEIKISQNKGKWEAEILSSDASVPDGLQRGDILLRDFATQSKLRDPLAVERLIADLDRLNSERVEFAIVRDGQLSSGFLNF